MALATKIAAQPRSFLRVCGVLLLMGLLAVPLSGCDRSPSSAKVRELHRQGLYAESLPPLRELLAAHPDDPEIHYLYGVALVQTGDSRVAVWSLRKAAEDPKFAVVANLELAAAAVRAANWGDAIDAAGRVLELDPDQVVAYFIRGEAYLGQGKEPELALEDFEQVLDREPENGAAKTSRAAALLLAGRVEEAAEAIDELETMAREGRVDAGTQARFCATQAVLASERGDFEKAEARLEECLERFPSDAVVIEPAVSFFDQKGRPERSTEILENALALVPEAQSIRDALASRAVARGDLDAAESLLREGTELENPQARTAAWTALTNHYLAQDDLPEAVAAYEQALALSQDPPQLAMLTYADLLARAGDHERALTVAKTLENASYRGLVESRVLLDQGHPAEALAKLDEVLPTWPNNAGARYYAARAAEQLGDFGRAIEEYRQSIRSAPEQTESALRLAKLYLAAGASQNAWVSAGQYFRAHPNDPEGVRILLQSAAPSETESLRSLFTRLRPTPLWAVAVAMRADTVAERRGTEAALKLLEETQNIDLTLVRNAELLRAKVILLVAAGRVAEARKAVDAAIAAQPENAAFLETHALLLESEEAPAESVRAAYERVLAVDSENARALEALGRLAEQRGDTAEALALYDRATAAYPERGSAALRAAMLAERSGQGKEAERRLEALLREHPWDAVAARELARLRLGREVADDTTLELAERAVLFRGGKEAQLLLVRVHEARHEPERALEISRAMETGEPIPPRKITPFDVN